MQKLLSTIFLALMPLFAMHASDYTFQEGKGMAFAWSASDVACAYTTGGDRIVLKPQTASADPHSVTFTGNGWALVAGEEYYAYCPYAPQNVVLGHPFTALPVSYSGQRQSTNGSTAHLSAYDFMTAQSQAISGSTTFRFAHLGSLLRISAVLPESTTLSRLTLSTGSEDIFVTEATMDATRNTLTPTAFDREMHLELGNITIPVGGTFTAYMMLAPADYSAARFCITLTTSDGNSTTIYADGLNLLPGRAYDIVGEIGEYCKQSAGFTIQDAESGMRSRGWNAEPRTLDSSLNQKTNIPHPTGYAADFALATGLNAELGDADGDGTITMADANAVVNYYLGNAPLPLEVATADLNRDNLITMADANAIVNLYLTGTAQSESSKPVGLTAFVRGLAWGGQPSATGLLAYNGEQMQFSWNAGERIGVFPVTDGSRQQPLAFVNGSVADGLAIGIFRTSENKYALDTEGVREYAAYSPYSAANEECGYQAVPISYLGQTQAANVSFTGSQADYLQSEQQACSHLGAVDFLVANAEQNDNFSTHFEFGHVGAVARIVVR